MSIFSGGGIDYGSLIGGLISGAGGHGGGGAGGGGGGGGGGGSSGLSGVLGNLLKGQSTFKLFNLLNEQMYKLFVL